MHKPLRLLFIFYPYTKSMILKNLILNFDERFIKLTRRYSEPFARFAIFLVFFWFGYLKIVGLSPAGPLVQSLLEVTFLSFVDAQFFVVAFGVFEVVLGILFLIPRLERLIFALLIFHLATTVMPLLLLPEITWDGFLVPTLVGQYIIKNILLLAIELVIVAHLRPMRESHSFFSKS